MIGDIDRRVPERHDTIADIFIDRSLPGDNIVTEPAKKIVEKPDQFDRREPFAERREIANIDEHHRHVADLTAKLQGLRILLDSLKNSRCDKL